MAHVSPMATAAIIRVAAAADLHSFPTRRSSDLGCIAAPAPLAHTLSGDTDLLRCSRHEPRSQGEATGNPEQPTKDVVIDRKSTRLNSSHSQISYAVFCLKRLRGSPDGPRVAYGDCCHYQSRRRRRSTLFPYTTLFRSRLHCSACAIGTHPVGRHGSAPM